MSRHTIWSKQKIGKLVQPAREPVEVCADQTYREIGIRSHGKGIFYKDEVLGLDLGSKRVFWVEPGCFVVNIVFAWEQAVAKTTNAEKGMIASHRFPMYRPLTDKIDLDYLLYFFKTPHGKYLLELASPGGAGRNKTLGQEAFLELAIPVPPIEEQRKIAEILSTWDEAIRLTQELIVAKQQRKKGLMQRLLTGQVRFKEFGERPGYRHTLNKKVPLDWQILEFGNFVEKINTKFDPQNENMELPCVELEHIAQESGQLLGYTTTTHQRSVKNRFHSGDILFGKLRPYLKKYARPDFDGVCSSEIWVISGKKGLCRNDFLFYLIQSDRFIMAANVTSGTKMPRADWEYVSEFAFAIPPAEEQGRIASVLQACDYEIQLLQQKLAALQQQKKGLMQRLLTGQVRVKAQQSAGPKTP